MARGSVLKLSFTTMASPDWDGVTAIRKAREYGYQGVDLRVSDHLGELRPDASDDEIRALRRVFDAEGIEAPSVLAYNAKVTGEAHDWEPFERSVRDNLSVGARLGARHVRIFVRDPDAAKDRAGFLSKAADVLARVLSREDGPTGLLIQNHIGGAGVRDILTIMEQADTPRLGLVLCPEQTVLMGEEIGALLPVLAPSLPQLYVADMCRRPGGPDDKHVSALPGEGVIDYRPILSALGGDRFAGWVTFKWEKIWQPDLPGPEVALPHFIRYIRSCV